MDVYLASAGCGKLFPVGTKVYTPRGYVNIEDIQVGDEVLSYDNICSVKAKYHQLNADIYRITFSDGTSIEACEHHNWWVRNSTHNRKNRKWRVLTTGEILRKGIRRNAGNPKWEIPLCRPLQFNTQEVPISPYTLGALLGDGYIAGGAPILTTMDEEIINRVLAEGYHIIATTFGNSGRAFNYKLDAYIPKEWRHTSKTKYIPEVYKYNNEQVRFTVLQGLLDTDGCVDLAPYRNGSGNFSPSVNYCSISEQLANDVVFLVQSLGGTATISKHRSLYKGKEYNPHYNVRICLPPELEAQIFSVPRKRDRLITHERRILPRRKITDITYVGQKEGYCLTVDSRDSTYIVQDCIVTHNTSRLMTIVEDYIKQGYELDDIAFVTFTRKGADVAKQRICESQGISPSKAKYFSTIHSMCFRALKCSKDIMMDKEKYRDFALKAGYNFGRFEGLNSTEGIDWKDMRDSHLINMEQLYRNNRNYWDKVVGQYVDNGRFVQYVKLYNQYKNTMHFYDFTDLLEMYIGRGLESSAKVVCIDEAQDCSILQWQVLFKAFKNAEHICVAGDVKQSIYCFAGAEPNVLLKLRGEQHLLNKSYRVPIKLLDFAQKIANELSVSDHMVCTSTKEGGKLDLLVSIDEFRYRKDKSIMMLCRNRKQFAYYIDWCKKQAVPYTINSSPVFTDSDKIAFRDSVLMNKPSPYEEWPEDKKIYALDCYKAGTFFSDPNIIISTIHGVKGDEADIVVLQSDIGKLVAKGMDVDEDAEHRVFYVAVTRAKEELYIIAPQTKLYYPYILF